MIKEPYHLFTRLLEKILLRSPPTPRRGKSLFVACFPKSGSTYLTKLLAKITGFRLVVFVNPGLHNEQDISEVKIGQCRNLNTVVHQHVKGTENNVRILKSFDIKPIVLVRNIFDVVPSLRDHLARESIKGPTGYVHQQFLDMTEEEKLTYIARIHVPWYFSFLISWKEASRGIDTFWTSYEELFADQTRTVRRILEFQDVPVDKDRIVASIAAMSGENTRRNQAVSGRGQALPNGCKQTILQIADCWKIDNETLASVGIPTPTEEKFHHLHLRAGGNPEVHHRQRTQSGE